MDMISVGSSVSTTEKYIDMSRPTTPKTEGFKRITKGQIKDILATPQLMRSDCYLVSSLKALAKSGFGKQMLKNSIKTSKDGDTFEVQFKKYDGKNTYNIQQNQTYQAITGRNKFNTTGAVESATNYVVQDRFSAKPLMVRLAKMFSVEGVPVEYNSASTYMEALTGKKPISIGDSGITPLSYKKEETTELLDKIGDLPINRHSFVAGSKFFGTDDDIATTHYFVVKKVDNEKKEVHLVNPRYFDISDKEAENDFKADIPDEKEQEAYRKDLDNMPKVYKMSYERFMKNFRSLVGYFDEKTQK